LAPAPTSLRRMALTLITFDWLEKYLLRLNLKMMAQARTSIKIELIGVVFRDVFVDRNGVVVYPFY
jgi:hypothetical protein